MPADRDTLRWLRDRAEITDVVLTFARAFDDQDWPALRACLAPTVEVDYRDLRGDAPRTLSADEYVAAREAALGGLRTQHISSNHLVRLVDDAHAECASAFLIHRLDPRRPEGENVFDTAGHYRHWLERAADGWRITRIEQRVLWSRGTPAVHGALRAAQGGPGR